MAMDIKGRHIVQIRGVAIVGTVRCVSDTVHITVAGLIVRLVDAGKPDPQGTERVSLTDLSRAARGETHGLTILPFADVAVHERMVELAMRVHRRPSDKRNAHGEYYL